MRAKTERVTRLDYCQYLLVSQINYTLTNYAEHTEKFSHDMANRYVADDALRPHLVWENIGDQVVQTPYGFLVFDDTIVDKNFSHKIELVRRQYGGNAHGAHQRDRRGDMCIRQPGGRSILDHRLSDLRSGGDGQTKLDHVAEMLRNCVYQKQLALWAVLMDTWYATKGLLLQIGGTQS